MRPGKRKELDKENGADALIEQAEKFKAGIRAKVEHPFRVARQIRGIFNASDAHEAQRMLNVALKEWQVSHPQLAAWAEIKLSEGFAVFNLPDGHRVRMRTTNEPPMDWSA